MWLLYAFLAGIFGALVAIFGKVGLSKIDPILANTVRGIIMALILIAASITLGKFNGFTWETFTTKEWWMIVLAGLAGATSWVFYFFALQSGAAGEVAAIDRLNVVFVVLFAALFLGESLTATAIAGVLLVTIGAVLIALPN